MVDFYQGALAMKQATGEDTDRFRQFIDYGTEIHLERVPNEEDHEVLGALQLYSINPDELGKRLESRGIRIERRTIKNSVELLFSDPDGNRLTIVSKEKR